MKHNKPFYMDDLKLFAKNDQQLEGLLNIVKQFSHDIGMELGLDKCSKSTFSRGKLLKAKNITLDTIPQRSLKIFNPRKATNIWG